MADRLQNAQTLVEGNLAMPRKFQAIPREMTYSFITW